MFFFILRFLFNCFFGRVKTFLWLQYYLGDKIGHIFHIFFSHELYLSFEKKCARQATPHFALPKMLLFIDPAFFKNYFILFCLMHWSLRPCFVALFIFSKNSNEFLWFCPSGAVQMQHKTGPQIKSCRAWCRRENNCSCYAAPLK